MAKTLAAVFLFILFSGGGLLAAQGDLLAWFEGEYGVLKAAWLIGAIVLLMMMVARARKG